MAKISAPTVAKGAENYNYDNKRKDKNEQFYPSSLLKSMSPVGSLICISTHVWRYLKNILRYHRATYASAWLQLDSSFSSSKWFSLQTRNCAIIFHAFLPLCHMFSYVPNPAWPASSKCLLALVFICLRVHIWPQSMSSHIQLHIHSPEMGWSPQNSTLSPNRGLKYGLA